MLKTNKLNTNPVDFRVTLGDRGPPFGRYVIQYGVDSDHVTRLEDGGSSSSICSASAGVSVCRVAYYVCMTTIVTLYAADICVLARRTPTSTNCERNSRTCGGDEQQQQQLQWHWSAHLSLCTAASVQSILLVAGLVVRVQVESSLGCLARAQRSDIKGGGNHDVDDENERVLRCLFANEENSMPQFTSKGFVSSF